MTNRNTFHYEIAALTSGQQYQVPITDAERQEIDKKAFNVLVFYNGTGNLYMVQLNNDASERYPCPANGGRVVISNDDGIDFSSVQIIEKSASNATGTSFLTVAHKPVVR